LKLLGADSDVSCVQWMYIVPFAFIVINALSQLANMPEEGQAGQGPAVTAPAQRTGGSGGGRTRR
jgi:hypothetical protein